MKKMPTQSLIVFDMDGVIIDVSGSYRETVRQTARLFFKGARSWKDLPDPLFPLSDLATVKQSGGLNNDWDLTFLVIGLLFYLVNEPVDINDPDPWSRYSKMIAQCDVVELSRYLKSIKNPLTSLLNKYDKPKKNIVSSFYVGDVGSGNIIKHIFQEIYLGKKLFEPTYGIPTKAYHSAGYINKENLLIDHIILERLSKNNILTIATGRPKAEADYPLNYFKLERFFKTIYTLDDCLREEKRIRDQEGKKVSLSKPDPFMLDAVAETHQNEVSGYYYVGDMPDDMVAAKNSKTGFTAIGILISSPDKENLKKKLVQAGADYIIDDFTELIRLVETGIR
ncbi:MAG: HAD family hydrolase [Planctomycetota bacterium]|jgi:phosphoglycolate phosphatase-like HAD superfamily hydrolase